MPGNDAKQMTITMNLNQVKYTTISTKLNSI